jgi:hypothetical protein
MLNSLSGRRRPRRATVALVSILVIAAPAVVQADRGGHRHHDNDVVRAALHRHAIRQIFVVELENEGEATTFGPGSPAT